MCKGCCEFLCLGIKEVSEYQASSTQHGCEAKCYQVVLLWSCLLQGQLEQETRELKWWVTGWPLAPSSLLVPWLTEYTLESLFFWEQEGLTFFLKGEIWVTASLSNWWQLKLHKDPRQECCYQVRFSPTVAPDHKAKIDIHHPLLAYPILGFHRLGQHFAADLHCLPSHISKNYIPKGSEFFLALPLSCDFYNYWFPMDAQKYILVNPADFRHPLPCTAEQPQLLVVCSAVTVCLLIYQHKKLKVTWWWLQFQV